MSRVITIVWILLTLIGAWMFTAKPGHAQSQVRLDAVEPPEGQPGQQLELTLLGAGFGGAGEVQVLIGELEVMGAEVLSDDRVLARVYIPEIAPPGPRPVEVVAVFGENEEFRDGLEVGFWVQEPDRPPPGTEPPPEQPPQPPPQAPQLQAQVNLRAVEPPEGHPGQELELTLSGNGFPVDCVRCQAQVVIGGFDVQDVRVETNERIVARVRIPEDAPPGPRAVEVHVFLEARELALAQLAGGFVVLQGPEPPPPPTWIGFLILIFVVAMAGLAGRRLFRWRQEMPRERPTEKPAPPPAEMHFEVGMDPGRQSIETPGQGLKIDIDIRLVTSIDYGEQSVEVEGGSITG